MIVGLCHCKLLALSAWVGSATNDEVTICFVSVADLVFVECLAQCTLFRFE